MDFNNFKIAFMDYSGTLGKFQFMAF